MSGMGLSVLAVMAAVLLPVRAWMTDYDQRFTFSCHDNQFLSFIESIHDNGKEDRVWNFKCANLPADTTLSHCNWSGWVNAYDAPVSFHCPNDGVIVGMDSQHDNGPEDRRFSFLCCSPGDHYITHKCSLTDYLNDWDGHLEFQVPADMVLTGMYSVHSNHQEDRRFKFDVCRLDQLVAEEPVVG